MEKSQIKDYEEIEDCPYCHGNNIEWDDYYNCMECGSIFTYDGNIKGNWKLEEEIKYCLGCKTDYSIKSYISDKGLCGKCENIDKYSLWKKWDWKNNKWIKINNKKEKSMF
ncbi:MAG: hypothetical protein ACFFG0_07805 [Candidatus Thorarchaeota archaeon]